MPKITSNVFRIEGQLVNLETWYNTKKGFYFKNFPDKILKSTGFELYGSKSEDKLYAKFRLCLSEYHSLIEKKTKMILIELSVGKKTQWKSTGSGGWSKKSSKDNVGDLDCEHGIGLDYEIIYKIDSEKTDYYYCREDGSIGGKIHGIHGSFNESINSEKILIPYSEKSESFLIETCDQLLKLSLVLIKFFKSDDLIQLMSRNVKLLK